MNSHLNTSSYVKLLHDRSEGLSWGYPEFLWLQDFKNLLSGKPPIYSAHNTTLEDSLYVDYHIFDEFR